MKIGLEKEIGVTESQEVPEFREFNEGTYRMYFFMLSCLIFKSTVERGIPSLAAARFAPETRSLNLAGAKLPGKKAGNQCSGNSRWNSMIS